MTFKFWDKLDLKAGDIIRINGLDVRSSTHIIVKVHNKPYGDREPYAVDAYTLLCDEPYYEDDLKAGEVTHLYLKEFLLRSEENSLEILHRVHSGTIAA